jgi:gliding motility-associated-like protein
MQLDPNFINITPGSHYLAISHTNGCVLTLDFDIIGFEPLGLTLEQRNLNEITALATGGVEEYTFYFNGVDNGNDNTYYINETGTYSVMVVDQSGCVAEAQIFMEFIDIEMPNFFTPDGDGMNDLWIPENIEGFPQILIKIYDRYGRVVDEISYNYPGWDGNYDGKELPTGDYWYTIQLNGENDPREFVGHFTLYR